MLAEIQQTVAALEPSVTGHRTVGPALRDRLLELWELTGDVALLRLGCGEVPAGMNWPNSAEAQLDLVSSCLMDSFRTSGDARVFAALFDLNHGAFMIATRERLRRYGSRLDPQDVLQEVFLNIYRYPGRFRCEHHASFRNWGHRIVQNAVFTCLKGESRVARVANLEDSIVERVDETTKPCRSAADSEEAPIADFAYLLYLNLYLRHYRELTAREQQAMQMVELDQMSYGDAAARLGIRMDNLRMMLFRARRKIYDGLDRTLRDLSTARIPALA